MKVKDIMELFQLESVTGNEGLDHEVTGGYCGDLLSDVMANNYRAFRPHLVVTSVILLVGVQTVLFVMAEFTTKPGRRPPI